MSNRKKVDTLILGAGPAGLTAGYRLTKNNRAVGIVEKETEVGGLSKTLVHNDIRCDIGPHILCSKEYVYDYNPEMYSFIKSLLGDELYEYESENQLYLESVQIKSKKFKYPVSIFNAIQNVGLLGAVKIGIDYVYSLFTKKSQENYEVALISTLGKKLAGLFLLNIGEKTWGCPCSKMSADVAWRVGDFSIFDVLKKQGKNILGLLKKTGNPVSYPKRGIGVICDRLKEEIDKTGQCSWFMSSIPRKIVVDSTHVISVDIESPSGIDTVYPQDLISSIPLQDLLGTITPKPPEEVMQAAKNLRSRAHVCVYLVFQAKTILKEHCIYFADLEIPFSRMMEQNHYYDGLVPEGNTVLAIEYFCWSEDNVWNMSDEELSEMTVEWLKKIDVVDDEKLLDSFINRENNAYPAYELGYEKSLEIVKDYLNKIDNLKIIGRVGSFEYCGQYKAMQMGWDAVDIKYNER